MARPSDFLTFFSTYLSQEVTQKEGEARLDCPFLDCENPSNHFYANLEDGTWTCKRCDKAGNTRTLITLLHEQFLETTTPSQYHSLSEVRGLRGATLENAGFAYDHINNRWLVPYYTYNPETNDWSPFLNNLGYFYPYSANEDSRFVIKKGKGLALYLYNPGLHQYPPSDTAIICEGEWDTLAYVEIDPDSTELILGKPGAGFKVDYLRTLSKTKKVYLFLDNDDAGRKQTATSIKVLQNDISNISTLDWTLVQDAPNDIRDLYLIQGEDTLSIIQRALVQYDISRPVEKEILKSYQTTLEDYTAVEDFDTYISNMKKHLYLTSESILSMAAVLGITNSISIPGEPLWVFLVGPPSAGKTQFIDSFGGNNERFDNLSKITAKALVSGWKDETGEEASYIEKLPGKTLFIKDFTATLSDSL